VRKGPTLAIRKKQDVGVAEALLTTAQMIGSALGKIAVRTGLDQPTKAATKRKKAVTKKKAPAKPAKAASEKALTSTVKRARSGSRAKKRS
jgi:hypothetical protein